MKKLSILSTLSLSLFAVNAWSMNTENLNNNEEIYNNFKKGHSAHILFIGANNTSYTYHPKNVPTNNDKEMLTKICTNGYTPSCNYTLSGNENMLFVMSVKNLNLNNIDQITARKMIVGNNPTATLFPDKLYEEMLNCNSQQK